MIIEFIIPSIILGITIGLTPGPTLFVTINETIEKGLTRGSLPVLLGMLLTDLVIIIPLTFIISAFFQNTTVQLIMAIVGGLVLILLGLLTIKSAYFNSKETISDLDPDLEDMDTTGKDSPSSFLKNYFSEAKESFSRIIVVQMLNPLAYIFWITVGVSQMMFIADLYGLAFFFLFPVSFWIGIISVSLIWAILGAQARSFMSSSWYRRVQLVCGLFLIFFGILQMI